MQKQRILVNNRQISFTTKGAGDSLLLLHGFMESVEIWEDYIDVLSEGYRVIAVDLPGHGDTHQFGSVHRMDEMARVVHQVVVNLGVGQCIIIGHSMGGYVALEFAALFPEMLKGLCLFHSNANEDSPETKLNRNRAISFIQQNRTGFTTQFIPDLFAPDNREKHADMIKTLQKRASRMTSEGIIAAMEGMKNRRSHHETLRNIKAPVLYIVGQKDIRIDPEEITEQIHLPENCSVLFLRECGHMGFIENRDECLKAIQGFLPQADI